MIIHPYSYQNARIIVAEMTKTSSEMICDLQNFDLYNNEYQEFKNEKRRREIGRAHV